jgi:hypothetical protein
VRQVGHLQESLDNFLVGFYIVLRSRVKETVSIYEACKAREEKKEINNSEHKTKKCPNVKIILFTHNLS